MNLRSKLPDTGTSIFVTMTQLANAHGAINLSQGFPDFDAPPQLIERVTAHMRAGRNQYAPTQGVLALREAIAAKVHDLYHAAYDPATEITVTSGATEAVYTAITAVVHPGDEVVVFEPAYDAYLPAILLSGGRPLRVPLQYPGYRIDWEAVRQIVSARTRLIILNSPHNPTGSVLGAEDLAALKALVADTGMLILSDEVYEHIIFDGRTHRSLSADPELARRSFVVASFGKTYHATGWKIGYCLAPVPLSAEFQRIHQFLTFSANTPVQHAYADLLAERELFEGLAAFYEAKRDTFARLIAPSGFKVLPCQGTYFQMLDYSALSDEPDTAFAHRLTVDHGVAAIPPSVFYQGRDDHHVLRFCFAKQDETLKQAAERLCAL